MSSIDRKIWCFFDITSKHLSQGFTMFRRKHAKYATIFSDSRNKIEFIAFTRQKAYKVGKYFAKLLTVQEWKFRGFSRNMFFPCIMFTFDIMLLSCIFHHRAEFTNESNVALFIFQSGCFSQDIWLASSFSIEIVPN